MTMTKNSKSSNISKQAHSSFSIAEYEIMLFCTAMNFLKCNNFHFDDKDIFDIKELFIEDIDKRKASQKDKDEVAATIDRYYHYKDAFTSNTRKVMIQELDDLFFFCIDIIRDASMNGKKSTSKRTIDDYYKIFIEDIDRYKNLLHNIEKVDVLYIMFDVMCGCKDFGGDFHMIDALYNKLGEYLEANYKD